MNKGTRRTIEFRENWLKKSLLACLPFYYTYESCIFMREVRVRLNRGTIV